METFWAFQCSKKEFCAFNTKRQSYIPPSTFSLLKRKAEHFYCCGGQKSGKRLQQKYQNKRVFMRLHMKMLTSFCRSLVFCTNIHRIRNMIKKKWGKLYILFYNCQKESSHLVSRQHTVQNSFEIFQFLYKAYSGVLQNNLECSLNQITSHEKAERIPQAGVL